MNPYHPPTNHGTLEIGSRVCPDCGALMKPGNATGSLYWNDQGVSFLKRLLSRGKALMGGNFRITLTTPRLPGFYCGKCGLIMLKENR